MEDMEGIFIKCNEKIKKYFTKRKKCTRKHAKHRSAQCAPVFAEYRIFSGKKSFFPHQFFSQ